MICVAWNIFVKIFPQQAHNVILIWKLILDNNGKYSSSIFIFKINLNSTERLEPTFLSSGWICVRYECLISSISVRPNWIIYTHVKNDFYVNTNINLWVWKTQNRHHKNINLDIFTNKLIHLINVLKINV